MSFFTPDVEAVRLWMDFLRLTVFCRFLHDIRGSYLETFRQHDLIRPWYLILPLLCIKCIAVAAYAYGRNRDSWRVNEDLVAIKGKKQTYAVQVDRGERERDLCIGILGQPERTTQNANVKMPSHSSSRPRIAVICPVYLSDLDADVIALKRLHECLQSQDR